MCKAAAYTRPHARLHIRVSVWVSGRLSCARLPALTHAFGSLFALRCSPTHLAVCSRSEMYIYIPNRVKSLVSRVFFPTYSHAFSSPSAHLLNCFFRAEFKHWNFNISSSTHNRPHSILSFSFLRFPIIWHFLHATASKMSIWYVFIHFKVLGNHPFGK